MKFKKKKVKGNVRNEKEVPASVGSAVSQIKEKGQLDLLQDHSQG